MTCLDDGLLAKAGKSTGPILDYHDPFDGIPETALETYNSDWTVEAGGAFAISATGDAVDCSTPAHLTALLTSNYSEYTIVYNINMLTLGAVGYTGIACRMADVSNGIVARINHFNGDLEWFSRTAGGFSLLKPSTNLSENYLGARDWTLTVSGDTYTLETPTGTDVLTTSLYNTEKKYGLWHSNVSSLIVKWQDIKEYRNI